MRRRLEEKLQAQVEQHGAIFPPQPKEGAPSPPAEPATAHGLRSGGVARVAGKKSR
jgi:hypothetical protein